MARRNFYDIITNTSFNLRAEYARLQMLFFENTDNYCSISDMVENSFNYFPSTLIGRTISLSDFDDTYGFNFPYNPPQLTPELLISFAEYILNFCHALLSFGFCTLDEEEHISIRNMQKQVNACMADLGMAPREVGELLIFVEDRPEVVAVAEILDDELADAVMRYHHHTLKGDLTKKKAVLTLMANSIENERQQLRGINRTLETQLFQLLNKFIRHNQSNTPYIATMSPVEIEEIYDDIYQMWLLSRLELDHHTNRANRITDLLSKLNG